MIESIIESLSCVLFGMALGFAYRLWQYRKADLEIDETTRWRHTIYAFYKAQSRDGAVMVAPGLRPNGRFVYRLRLGKAMAERWAQLLHLCKRLGRRRQRR